MKLFKREPGNPACNYSVKFMVHGKSYLWSTKTNRESLARQRARVYREAIVAEQYHLADSMKAKSSVPTFEEIFKQYKGMPLGIDGATLTKNVSSMKQVLEASNLKVTDRVDRLDRHVALAFQKASQTASVPPSTINSRLRAARSLFTARTMMQYRPQLPLSFIDDFKLAPYLREAEKLPELPPPDLVEKAHVALAATPDIYRAFLLACYGGLRSGEVAAARWDWLDGDVIFIGGREFQAKSRKWRSVEIDHEVIAIMHNCGDKIGDFIAGEYPKKTAKRLLVPALRALGITLTKPAHSLRRLAGSVVADAQGIYAAQNMLGHSTPAVTVKHYARQLNLPKPVPYQRAELPPVPVPLTVPARVDATAAPAVPVASPASAWPVPGVPSPGPLASLVPAPPGPSS